MHPSCLHCRYKASDLENVQRLKEEYQKMARVLQAAQQEEILEVYLAKV